MDTLAAMANADPTKRVNRAVQALQAVPDPLARLDTVRWARQQLEELEAGTVRAARESGATWKQIGAVYGLTKQGAQQRFSAAVEPPGGQPFQTSAEISSHNRR